MLVGLLATLLLHYMHFGEVQEMFHRMQHNTIEERALTEKG